VTRICPQRLARKPCPSRMHMLCLVALWIGCVDDTRLLAERSLPNPPACNETPQTGDLLLYRFEEPAGATFVTDAVGAHPGTARAPGASTTSGPTACGAARLFESGPLGFPIIEVPHHPDFNLTSGSLSFWVRLPAARTLSSRGIVSRDAFGEARPGHLSVYEVASGHLVVRLQGATSSGARCSEAPLPPDVWIKVGVNFGAPGLQLFVNDAEQMGIHPNIVVPTSACGRNTTDGIDGNENPWVLGASSDGSVEGTADPFERTAQGVAIDAFRVSRARITP
jgi:hypothetical protein